MKGVLSTSGLFTLILTGCQLTASSDILSASEALYAEPRKTIQRGTGFVGSTTEGSVEFTFNSFGDSGWADTHSSPAIYKRSFLRAYQRFDPSGNLIGDLNYINWETSVGTSCTRFWSPKTPSTFAFLTHPQDLSDAISKGFNLVGLANNHSYDCLASPEGNGPRQTISHLNTLATAAKDSAQSLLISGVALNKSEQLAQGEMRTKEGSSIPISFMSAYVGGDKSHCTFILCDADLPRFKQKLSSAKGLRILALHSWDPSSHSRLKSILRSWLSAGVVDVAIGTGPHIAEKVDIIKTPRGARVLSTSLGNFIHPSLSPQPNNIVLKTAWSYDNPSSTLTLRAVTAVQVSCDGGVCHQGPSRALYGKSASPGKSN